MITPGKVAHDGGFVLQVVVQPQALGGQVLADYRHGEVRTVLPAQLLGEPESQVARGVGPLAHLLEQRLPVFARPPAVVPVGARVFSPMVEESLVALLHGLDVALDEAVQLVELVADFLGDVEVQTHSPLSAWVGGPVGWRSRLESIAVEGAAQ